MEGQATLVVAVPWVGNGLGVGVGPEWCLLLRVSEVAVLTRGTATAPLAATRPHSPCHHLPSPAPHLGEA